MRTKVADRGRIVEWCRKGYTPWRGARKRAVRLWRAGHPMEWITRALRVSRQWVRKWVHRYQEGGMRWAALDDRSSRPHTIHAKRHAHVDDVLAAKQQYPNLCALKLRLVAKLPLSHDTVHRVLSEHRLVQARKRKHHVWRRFQRPLPNYLWQLDITYVRLRDGSWAFVATLLDDCTRFVLASRVYERDPTAGDMIRLVETTIRQWGRPRQVLTDRGTQFSANKTADAPALFTQWLVWHGVEHIRARPRHPQTCGKLERWHRSLKEEWLSPRGRPASAQHLRTWLDAWLVHYNTIRPHASIGYRVPVEAYLESFILNEALGRVVNEVV